MLFKNEEKRHVRSGDLKVLSFSFYSCIVHVVDEILIQSLACKSFGCTVIR